MVLFSKFASEDFAGRGSKANVTILLAELAGKRGKCNAGILRHRSKPEEYHYSFVHPLQVQHIFLNPRQWPLCTHNGTTRSYPCLLDPWVGHHSPQATCPRWTQELSLSCPQPAFTCVTSLLL